MSELTIPNTPDELNEIWLTQALKSTGTIKQANVASFTSELMGEGTGFLGTLARVSLEYDTPEEGAPASLIAKHPATAPENHIIAMTFRFYEREVNYYRHAAEISCLRSPVPYYGDIDESGEKFVLLLEDLGKATVDQIEGASAETCHTAMMELAKFHAQFAPIAQNNEMDWMLDAAEEGYVGINSAIYNAGLEPTLENFGEHFSPDMRDLAITMADKIPPLMQDRVEEGVTLIHGDYKLDNLFMGRLPKRDGFPESGLAVVDWQICCKAECVSDLAYHMCSLDIETRREIEKRALADYHKTLVASGVKGYPFDTFMIQYRRALLFSLLYAVGLAGTADKGNERGMELCRVLLDRTLAAIGDNNCIEVMPVLK
ncbi:MAG: phosphotransferase [Proteobacteria bacterium]|nr:phosphotransferase [Pseudomonadota bacterium]